MLMTFVNVWVMVEDGVVEHANFWFRVEIGCLDNLGFFGTVLEVEITGIIAIHAKKLITSQEK